MVISFAKFEGRKRPNVTVFPLEEMSGMQTNITYSLGSIPLLNNISLSEPPPPPFLQKKGLESQHTC